MSGRQRENRRWRGTTTARFSTLEVHPLEAQAAGLTMRMATFPAAATSAALSAMVTRLADTKVTARAWPATVAMTPLTKFEPLMVRLKPSLPAFTPDGLSDEMA